MQKDAVAIIPARSGSKRIPKKNVKDFFGKPLIAYSIETALASNLFEKVVVTTDDEQIAKIAQKFGAEVPFIRPKELSDDFTGTVDVVNHAIEYLESKGESYEYICTIYATAPLLQEKYLIQGYESLKNSDAVNAFSATTMPFPIQRTFKLDANGRCEMFTPEHYMTRSQDLEEAYQDAGQFYFTNRTRQIESKNKVVFSDISIPIILPRHLVQDIDTLEDWTRAEYMYQVLNQDIYDKWNNLKKSIDNKKHKFYTKNTEIYFMSIGQNVGFESYGKDELFLRPVLVYKRLSKNTFLGIPLTSKEKVGSYYFKFSYKKDKYSYASLNQLKVFDTKRIQYKSGNIKNEDFEKLKNQMEEFIKITSHLKKGEGCITSKKKQRSNESIIPNKDADVK
jgi:pseudaminic acid cytidylyltransferase